MAFDELLADRVRTCLQQAGRVSEQKMFGGLAFLTGGHLTVGVIATGSSHGSARRTWTRRPPGRVCGPSA
jgi:hypothetical protein